jgi:aspartate carbamoyltransferase catalytic subunit
MASSNPSLKPVTPYHRGEIRDEILQLKHVIESQQFTVPLLMELFQRSRGMERVVARGGTLEYQNKILASLFYQASTRTRFCFEAAMYRLGGKVLSTEQASVFSSEISGEQIEDSIRILANYADVIVVRHSQAGGAERAAQVSAVPVINAGDGDGGQHPTQALLDLYTIYRERPLVGLSVAIIGELDRGRTARSLAYLLAKFERVKIFLVAPPELQMKPDILAYLEEHGVGYELETEIDRVISEVDVIYLTRIRPERVTNERGAKRYAVDSELLRKMKSDALILHPLPRTVELDQTVDDDPRALYFRQAANGLYVRMALLTMLLDKN